MYCKFTLEKSFFNATKDCKVNQSYSLIAKLLKVFINRFRFTGILPIFKLIIKEVFSRPPDS